MLDFIKGHVPYLFAGAAGLVALWGQFRNFVTYLFSFLIIRASYDDRLSRALAFHLRRNYRVLPSGLYNFRSLIIATRSHSIAVAVPFRMPANTAFYYGPRGWFLVNAGEGVNVIGVRGLSNILGLLSDALDFDIVLTEGEIEEEYNTFTVIKIMGSMGDSFEQYRRSMGRETGGESKDPSRASMAIQTNGSYAQPNLKVDLPLKYSPADFILSNTKDPFRGLFYSDAAHDLIEDALRWKKNQKWYLDRGIPWRRGWLLHGPGGTGKSSMAKAIAQKLGLRLYQFYLSTLNDREFIKEWEGMLLPAMVLFEDFDNIYNLREATTEHKALTFDCVLNQIQGVSSSNGVLLIVTTNRIERIDPALGQLGENGMSTLPGRIDKIVYFGETDVQMRKQMVEFILPDYPEHHRELVTRGEGMTPAQFQHILIEAAFDYINAKATAKVLNFGR